MQGAALAGVLLLLGLPGPAWAAGEPAPERKLASRSTASKAATKPTSTPASKSALPKQSSEIGAAEIADRETIGLHGAASFYGSGFHGRRTATGEIFDARGFTAASNRFPLGTWLAVRRLDNDRCTIVKVNDRMAAHHRRRIIDVSRAAAEYLGMVSAGVVLVRVAPLREGLRDSDSCLEAFAPPEPPPEPPVTPDWRLPAMDRSLDAMQ